jgi:peptide/nickel transport system substrate-binding protein
LAAGQVSGRIEVAAGGDVDSARKIQCVPEPPCSVDRPVFWPARQKLAGHSRQVWRPLSQVALAAVAVLGSISCGSPSTPAGGGAGTAGRGGELVISVRTEPRSFNRLMTRDTPSDLVATLTQARLVRVNHVTQEVEPWLAESWARSDDGLRYTVKLRPNVTFSDGHPFTADDVLFTFEALYDEKTGAALADSLQIGGRKLSLAAPDPLTVVVTFPAPFGPGVRLLDNVPILPRHKLGSALAQGALAAAWGMSTPAADIVGLGPFIVTQYTPGQRLAFARNPHYWRKDAAGASLPYLDRVTMEIAPNQDSELLQLESGQIDTTSSEARPEDYASLKRAADANRLQLLDLGVGFEPDSFWFNLKPGALGTDPRAQWLQSEALRKAISLAVDRKLYADTVFLGAAVPVYGPITPANKQWYASDLAPIPHDMKRAQELLASVGLKDRNGDGLLEDEGGRPARFTILTQKGQTALERGAAVIRDALRPLGLVADVAPIDGNALIQRFLAAKYEAVIFHVGMTDTDPAVNPDFWFSSGTAHFWNISQKSAATDWERQIDSLMTRQISSNDQAERKRLFDQVQKIFAEHEPVIYFAAARIYVAASPRVTNLMPGVLRPQLLWAPDTLKVSR